MAKRSPLKLALQNALLFAVYYGSARLGLAVGAVSGFATLVWPPTGLALAALCIFGLPLWPAVALGAFLVNIHNGAPWYAAGGIAVGNTLEAVLGVYLLRKTRFEPGFHRGSDVLKLMLIAAPISAVVSSTFGVLSLGWGGIITRPAYPFTWQAWWLGDMIGDLVIAPFCLVWWYSWPKKVGPRRLAEAATLLCATTLICSGIFEKLPLPRLFDLPFQYFVFPPLLWSAIRFGQRGAVTTILLVLALAIWGTALGGGPFAGEPLSVHLMYLAMFMTVVTVTTLILAAEIIERKDAEHALIEALRQRDEFLSVASHELRTPVTSLHLQLQILQSLSHERPAQSGQSDHSSRLAKALLTFERSTMRLITLLDVLLDVTRIRVGKLKLERESFDLAATVREVALRFSEDAVRAQTVISVVSPKPVPGNWDLGRIEQVVTNLISNALKYGESKPIEVNVNFDEANGVATLEVIDHGIGIAPDLLPRLFQRFERAESSNRIQGLGLGLYISRQIAEEHDGTITVKSTVGKGSTFTLTLPIQTRS